MTTFDKREEGFEQKFAHEEAMRFKATARRKAALLSAAARRSRTPSGSSIWAGSLQCARSRRQYRCQVFFPSSIGAFGPSTPREQTPQVTVQRSTTMYGVTKVAAELLCDYYVERFGVDVRGLRLPGLISYVAPPGGGTTDYAVEIFYQALRYKHYTCVLKADVRLPMMYMPGCHVAHHGCGQRAVAISQCLQCIRHEHNVVF
jgi:nucleoside-diphosphate-sugar epimerase